MTTVAAVLTITIIGGLVYKVSNVLGILLLEVLRMPLIILHVLSVHGLFIFRDVFVPDYGEVRVAGSHAWRIS